MTETCPHGIHTTASPGNQHLYIDIGNDPGDSVTLKFAISTTTAQAAGLGDTTTSRTWSIRVVQVPCWSRQMARPDCRQYLTGTAGTVQVPPLLHGT